MPHDADIPDRGHLLTERRNKAAAAIDAMRIEEALQIINTQDAQVPHVVRKAIPQIARLVEDIVVRMRQGGRLIYLGAGTSGRLGVLDASECPPTFHSDPHQVIGLIAGGDPALRKSSEGQEDDPRGPVDELDNLKLTENDSIIGIAAGGTTPWVWGGIRYGNQHQCLTAIIVCVKVDSLLRRPPAPLMPATARVQPNPKPTLPAPVDHIIELPVGPEVVTGSTRMKAGTATKLVLNMISSESMIQLGKTWGNLMVDLRATNAKLRDRGARILMDQCDLTREQALQMLEDAGQRVKTAIVMAKRRVSRDEALQLLETHRQFLRPIVGPPR